MEKNMETTIGFRAYGVGKNMATNGLLEVCI